MTDLERELDRALTGKSHREEVAPLVETAQDLRSALADDVPEARAEALLFTHGVGLRKRSPLILRLLVPAIAVASVVIALVLVSRNAVPGDSFYPVRGALKKVGLATAPVSEIDREIRAARNFLVRADVALLDDPDRAIDLAFEAAAHLRDAGELLGDLDPDDRGRRATRIDVLEQRAATIVAEATIARSRDADRRFEDDNSGPGSDDDGDDDSSGPGSGDSDDDSSGPGSGDSDDSSGPGSGDSDDDSSGSGSGDSDDDDNSGKG